MGAIDQGLVQEMDREACRHAFIRGGVILRHHNRCIRPDRRRRQGARGLRSPLSADTTRSGSDFTLVKQFIVPYAGVVRVKWQLKSDGSHDAFAFVESQIDSCPVSSTTLATFETFSCKLRVVAGDLIEVTVRGEQVNIDPVAFSTGSVRRGQLFFDVVNSSGQGKTLAD
jgi:hypothetical protein